MHQSKPLVPRNPDGILRVILPARISTPQQDEVSMESTQDVSVKWVRREFDGPVEFRHLSEEASGWVLNRETIVLAKALIASGSWDAVVVNELREIYRNPAFLWAFIFACVDAGVRLIALDDNIDTANDDWEAMAHFAITRHGMAVPETRRRVRRKATYSFDLGGMVQRVCFGYRKLTKEEAASGQFGPVDLRVMKLAEYQWVFDEIRRRIRAGDSPDDVADWLNEQQVPLGPYAQSDRWTGRLVVGLIRNPILCGNRRFRDMLYVTEYGTGDKLRTRNPKPEMKYWPELAFYSEEEQQELLAILKARRKGPAPLTGADHPSWRTARADSLWPGQHATCNACGARMHRFGTMLRCPNAVSKGPKTCWNHCQVQFEFIFERIIPWILDELDARPAIRERLIDEAWQEFQAQRAQATQQTGGYDRTIARLEKEEANLTKAIREGGAIAALVKSLKSVTQAIKDAQAKKAAVEQSLARECTLTPDDIRLSWRDLVMRLAQESRSFAKILRKLVPKFTIKLVQALDCARSCDPVPT